MISEKKTNANLGIGIGIVSQLLGTYGGMGLVGDLLVIVGAGFFIWGCVNYAQGKGHSGWAGLLGFLSLLGLIVLVLLPDRQS